MEEAPIVSIAGNELEREWQTSASQAGRNRDRRRAEQCPDGLEATVAGGGAIRGRTGGSRKDGSVGPREEVVEEASQTATQATCVEHGTRGDDLSDLDRGAKTRPVGAGMPFKGLLVQCTHLGEHDGVVNGQEELDIDGKPPFLDSGTGFAEAPDDILQVLSHLRLGQLEKVDQEQQPWRFAEERKLEALVGTKGDVGVGDVLDRACEQAEVVERPGERNDPLEGEPAEARFEPHDPAIGGGAQDRAGSLGPDGERHLTGGDCCSRAGTRAARGSIECPRVARRSRIGEGELGRVCLPEDKGTQFPQPGDDGRIRLSGMFAERGEPGTGV